MPTLEEMRRWLRGEDVEGFPPHKPKVLDLFEIQTLPENIRHIEGQGALLEFQHSKHRMDVGKWGIHFKAHQFYVDIHADFTKTYANHKSKLEGWSIFLKWAEGEHIPVDVWLTTDARRRVWNIQTVFPLHIERDTDVAKPNVSIFHVKFKFGQWYALDALGACMRCGEKKGIELECSRTQYEWDGVGLDPNSPVPLCRDCAKEHHEYWDDMWAEYYAGRL